MLQTAWDKIYARHKKTGKKWASLGDPIHASFFSFMKNSSFSEKTALDLGCGDGKYLKFLQELGFKVAGIDSSPTAIKSAREVLGKKAELHVADIYATSIPAGKYDLVISVAAIQHAKKDRVKKLIDRIHRSLSPDGKIYITFPLMTSLRRWATFSKMKKVAPGTYIPLLGPEKGLPHSFYEKEELKKLFSKFAELKITRDDRGRWIVKAEGG
jgi:SAM-dependent methyltransferase